MNIRPITLNDYEAVSQLLQATSGVTFRLADSRDATARYLDRNPGPSFVATIEDEIIGLAISPLISQSPAPPPPRSYVPRVEPTPVP